MLKPQNMISVMVEMVSTVTVVKVKEKIMML